MLRAAAIIHCDLKPENVLLASTRAAACRVIDFGSACFEGRTVYSYIQSRFYRSPEVLLGHAYTTLVDIWSLGCIAAELFLGLPLFPGASDYDMLARIVAAVGAPPARFLRRCKLAGRTFVATGDAEAPARVMSTAEYAARHGATPEVGRQYFKHLGDAPPHACRLEDIVLRLPLPEGCAADAMAVRTPGELCVCMMTVLAEGVRGLLSFAVRTWMRLESGAADA